VARETGAGRSLNYDFNGVVTAKRGCINQFCQPARTPEREVIALAHACVCYGPDDAIDLAFGLVRRD
jgi:hypothetical protein